VAAALAMQAARLALAAPGEQPKRPGVLHTF
jgi:hypothetical protein